MTDKYEGEYLNDKKSGFGTFNWAHGNYYTGNYFDDQRNGYGEMYWNDGAYYKGQWERGVQSGEGLLYIPGEGMKKGLFVNNEFNGDENFERNRQTIHDMRLLDADDIYQKINVDRHDS